MESNVTGKQGERGFVLVLALLMLLVLTLIGASSLSSTNFEVLISGNKRISEKAFYSAEAGIHEFMARFTRTGATQEITDSSPSNPEWRIFLATHGDKVKQISGNPSQTFIPSLQNLLGYAVEVRYKLDKEGNVLPPKPPAEPSGIKCHKCKQGELVIRQSKKGPFLGCNKFPKCRTIVSYKQLDELKKLQAEGKWPPETPEQADEILGKKKTKATAKAK